MGASIDSSSVIQSNVCNWHKCGSITPFHFLWGVVGKLQVNQIRKNCLLMTQGNVCPFKDSKQQAIDKVLVPPEDRAFYTCAGISQLMNNAYDFCPEVGCVET